MRTPPAAAAALLLLSAALPVPAAAMHIFTYSADIFFADGDFAAGGAFAAPPGGTLGGVFRTGETLPPVPEPDPVFGDATTSLEFALPSETTAFDGLGAALFTLSHAPTDAIWDDDVFLAEEDWGAASPFGGRVSEGTYDTLILQHGVFHVGTSTGDGGGTPPAPTADDLVAQLIIIAGPDWYDSGLRTLTDLPPVHQMFVAVFGADVSGIALAEVTSLSVETVPLPAAAPLSLAALGALLVLRRGPGRRASPTRG